jgi:hypothetical protein
MKNPFKRFGSPNPSQYSGSRSSNKLIIVAGIVTFLIIIVVMFESVVVIQAGHRGVVLYDIEELFSMWVQLKTVY